MPLPRLHIDFETFSTVDLTVAGEDIYARNAFPLLMALKVDDEPTEVFDYAEHFNGGYDDFGDFDRRYAPPIPNILAQAFKERWSIVAHNASFEGAIFRNSPAITSWPKPELSSFICTAAKSRYWGLPSALDKVGAALDLATQKDKRGKQLIGMYCSPQKAHRRKGASTYIRKIDTDTDDWRAFRDYNRTDVEVEYLVDQKLPDIPAKFARIYYLDFAMNVRGFPVDVAAVQGAEDFYQHFYAELEKRFKEVCGGLAPTQVAAVRELLNSRYDCGLADLTAATIRDRLLEDDLHPDAREALSIRAEAAKASIKKLQAFLDRTGPDGRARGGFLWYGAHTGRWSGRGIQPQNFPRGTKETARLLPAFFAWLETAAGAPTRAHLETAGLVYPSPLAVLSTALRGFIKAGPGKLFVVVDYAQIELRVLAWLAGEQELLDQLRAGLDPYIQFAANYMYDVDPATITKDDLRRQIAKSALLGAQYQIWIWAFIEYCKATANLKITVEEATNAVLSYRSANPAIVDFWGDIEKAAIFAVEEKREARLNNLILRFETVSGRECLRVYLPSGRPITYQEPRVSMRETEHEKKDKDGNVLLDEEGMPVMYTKRKKVLSFMTEYLGQWTREYTYGGKLTENVVQAASYDIMGHGMVMAEENGFAPIMTVHDEAVTEIDDPGTEDERKAALKTLEGLVCQLPACYEGLPIAAEGFYCFRYRKG